MINMTPEEQENAFGCKNDLDYIEERYKGLERCGACGDFNCDAQTLNSLTEEEIAKIPLVHCGCEQDVPRYVTRDMAIDAGDRSLEGQRYN